MRVSAMFMTNCWQVAAYSAEVSHSLLKRRLLGEGLILYRTGAGAIVAMQDRCPHPYVPLSLGCLDGDVVQCGYHGLGFDASGACVHIPGQDTIPPKGAGAGLSGA